MRAGHIPLAAVRLDWATKATNRSHMSKSSCVAFMLPRALGHFRPADRLWLRKLAWLVLGGTFFYISYDGTNWLTSLRTHVPVVMFNWERSIPFLPWTIVPYWTTNFLVALSVCCCRSKTELDNHVCRLLTAQLIAVACFLAFPLQESLAKPATSGFFGFLFTALSAVDKPFNQAPSLHVATTVIMFDLYARVLPRWTLPMVGGWSLLIVVSTLTAWQHHFIDVPTGALLGLFCLWLWPPHGGTRLVEAIKRLRPIAARTLVR
jgi:membrane-associated phospholipid phosphatase